MKLKNPIYLFLAIPTFMGLILPPQGSYVTADRSRTFTISVNSLPTGAEVYLNDKFVGVTPLRRLQVKVDYSVSTAGFLFVTTGWSVREVKKDYYLFVKKKGYKTAFAKLAYIDSKGKLDLEAYKYSFALKEEKPSDESEPSQIEIRSLYLDPPENQGLEVVENRVTDFLDFRDPDIILPKYLYVSKEKLNLTKDICDVVEFLPSMEEFSWNLNCGYVKLDLRKYMDFFPYVRKIGSEEKTKKIKDIGVFGIFIDGELVAVTSLSLSLIRLPFLSFPYPWEWDDSRLEDVLKKIGIRIKIRSEK